jgi:hypothetical protein
VEEKVLREFVKNNLLVLIEFYPILTYVTLSVQGLGFLPLKINFYPILNVKPLKGIII